MPDVTVLRPDDPETIAGYRILSRLGAGGQGVVYLASTPAGERVAIKQLRLGSQDDRGRQQLVKEVAAARLVAPFCTAQVLDAQLNGPSPYIVSEYINGLSLQQRIEQRGPMTGAALQRMAIGTVTALVAIHQAGVVHRDFKPANVMLADDGPRVIDFGIARDLSNETAVTSRVFGTPVYMAPEQLRAERVGPAADLFAWASVIAYAATGRAPFEAPHLMAIMHRISDEAPDLTGVSPELTGVLSRCLTKDPAARPTAQQVLALLLDRPAPERDTMDPTPALMEATGFVRAAASSTSGQASPTVLTSGSETVVDFGAGGRADPVVRPPGQHPWRHGALAVGLLTLAATAIYGLGGLLRASFDPAGPREAPTAVTSNVATPSVAPTPVAAATSTGDSRIGRNDDGDGDDDDDDSGQGKRRDSGGAGTVPQVFDGTWEGVGLHPSNGVRSREVKLELDAGERTGELKLVGLKCSGKLTVISASDNALDLVAVMEDHKRERCATSARVRLERIGSERLSFSWEDAQDAQNRASGTLDRT